MKNLIDRLSKIEHFAGLPRGEIQWLAENSKVIECASGDFLFRKDDPLDHMSIVLQGRFTVMIEQNGAFRSIAEMNGGDITGNLPYSRAKNAIGFARAVAQSEVMRLHKRHFPEMIRSHHELTERLVHLLTSRVREFTKMQQQNEKLMSLGKLSAGLAHELNNPSAAVVRSAATLRRHLGNTPEKFKQVMMIRVSPAEVDAVNAVIFDYLARGIDLEMSMMARTALEDDVLDWLEEYDIEDADEIAETLSEYAIPLDKLAEIVRHVPPENLPSVMGWVNNVLVTEKLVVEIESASRRIADLVKSVKTYTHMDQGQDMQPADIRGGIRSTLTMLNHKLRQKNIEIVLDFPDDLPTIEAHAGELNQVWTNLIDNAIDAMSDNGTLHINARRDHDFVKVNFIDNGPGIPEEIQTRIFDPFFTTKGLQEGSGLGLDIVQRIVQQHRAAIRVSSQPGNTDFELCFPMSKKK